jgi:trigger factor
VLNSLIEKKEGGRVTLKVTIPAQEFDKTYAQALKKVAREHNFPGFRKGHAPKPVIEARLGQPYILSEAASMAISKTYLQAMKDHEVQPFGEPEYDVEQIEVNKDFIYNIIVDVLPEIELPEYKGIKVVRNVYSVEDDKVDTILLDLQKRQAQLVAIEDRDVVEDGDYILFDFKGFIDGEPFEGGAAENYTLQVGSGSFIPGFEEQLVGKKVRETGEVAVTFPEDYHQEAFAGKPAVFEVTINEIKKEELPELDDEFAKDVSDKETLEELKQQIREDLQKQLDERSKVELEDQLLEDIVQRAEFDVPPKMVEIQVEHMLNDFKYRVEYQGLSWESYLEYSKQTEEQLKQEFEPRALKAVKNYFVLNEIAKVEDIKVSEEDLDQKLEEIAEGYQVTKDMIRDYYEQNNRLSDLVYDMVTQKTLQFLVDNATVEEKVVESEED